MFSPQSTSTPRGLSIHVFQQAVGPMARRHVIGEAVSLELGTCHAGLSSRLRALQEKLVMHRLTAAVYRVI